LKPFTKDSIEALHEMFMAARTHIDCSARCIKDVKAGDKPLCNHALHHFAAMVYISLKIVCHRFAIEYADDDSIEVLLDNTAPHLPASVLAMKTDICYWHRDVQNKTADVKTQWEAMSIGATLERFFNEYVRIYAKEIDSRVKKSSLRVLGIAPLDFFGP
jgi:hypothetical protein